MPSTPSHFRDQHHDPKTGTPSDDAAMDETIRLPLVEETLEAHVVEAEQGTIRIHRRVETEPVRATVDLYHDRYVIDRLEVNEEASERREPWYEGESLMIPVYEEVLVTETRLVLREVIRLRNPGKVEQVNLTGTVRREVIDVEEHDASGRVSRPEETG